MHSYKSVINIKTVDITSQQKKQLRENSRYFFS